MAEVDLELTEGDVARIWLNRPEALNIYNLAMRDGLIEAFTAVGDMPDIRAVVLAARGRHFSAGADLSEFGSAGSPFSARRIRWQRDPWGALLGLDKPVVAALHGYALGAGMEMALLCDFRMAAPGCVLGLPETRLGMLPSAGGSQTLTRLVGPARSAPAVMLGENLEVERLGRLGPPWAQLIYRVVPDVDDAALVLAQRLATLPRRALRARLQMARAAVSLPGSAAAREEARLRKTYLLGASN